MPRKKSIKRKNIKLKRQKTNNKVVSVQKMEKELMQVPSKIISMLDKEIRADKKREIKLSKAVNKINVQVAKAEKKIHAAGDKKQKLKVANKKFIQAAKIQSKLAKDLQTVTESLEESTNTQSRFVALQKSMNQFNTEWTRMAKAAKNQSTQKAGKNDKRKAKFATVENNKVQQNESGMDNTTLDEVTELAS